MQYRRQYRFLTIKKQNLDILWNFKIMEIVILENRDPPGVSENSLFVIANLRVDVSYFLCSTLLGNVRRLHAD